MNPNSHAKAYRNQSQIMFNDSYRTENNQNRTTRSQKMKSSLSYKNHSTIGELFTDKQPFSQLKQEVRYKNNIQTIDKKYSVPKSCQTSNASRENKFSQFFQKNNQKFIKPALDSTQFSDIVSKNQILLRRGQFDIPTMKDSYTGFRKTSVNFHTNSNFHNSKTTNFIKSKYSKTKYFCSSILECNKIRKQSQAYFANKNVKDPFKISIAQHAQKYRQLLGKEREKCDDKILANSLNRMLVMEAIGQKIGASFNSNNTHWH